MDTKGQNTDFRITVQDAQVGVAYVKVEFYLDNMYHHLLKWAKQHGTNFVETTSGRLTKLTFDYHDYKVELTRHNNNVSYTENKSSTVEKINDRSYNNYTYTIFTGAEPYSDWHTKEASKAAKREAKDKHKPRMIDLM